MLYYNCYNIISFGNKISDEKRFVKKIFCGEFFL